MYDFRAKNPSRFVLERLRDSRLSHMLVLLHRLAHIVTLSHIFIIQTVAACPIWHNGRSYCTVLYTGATAALQVWLPLPLHVGLPCYPSSTNQIFRGVEKIFLSVEIDIFVTSARNAVSRARRFLGRRGHRPESPNRKRAWERVARVPNNIFCV